jgi:hypothetical protein
MTSATPHIPTLTTDRLVLRAPAPRDVPAFAAFYRSEASRFVGGPMTEAETWRYLCQVLGHWTMRGYGRWIVTTRDDDIAIGVVAALKQAGRDGDGMFVVGGAGMKETIKGIMDGNELVPVDVLYPPAMIATAMDVTVAAFKSNGPVAGRYILGATLITPENAEQFYFPDSPF